MTNKCQSFLWVFIARFLNFFFLFSVLRLLFDNACLSDHFDPWKTCLLHIMRCHGKFTVHYAYGRSPLIQLRRQFAHSQFSVSHGNLTIIWKFHEIEYNCAYRCWNIYSFRPQFNQCFKVLWKATIKFETSLIGVLFNPGFYVAEMLL